MNYETISKELHMKKPIFYMIILFYILLIHLHPAFCRSLGSSVNTFETPYKLKVNDRLPELYLKIIGHIKGNSFIPSYAEIRDSKMNIVQKLKAKNRFDNHGEGWSAWDEALADIVQLLDVNFDGYNDLRILYNTGATGNNWYATYLYNPQKSKFVYHDDLSMLCGLSLNKEKKQIITYNRNGWCWELMEFFKFKNNKLHLIHAEWTQIHRENDEPICKKVKGIPRNKLWSLEDVNLYFFDAARFEKRMKIIQIEKLYGSLDGRRRSPLGIPYK